MKKLITLVLVLVCVLGLVGYQQEDTEDILHIGLNAEIIEIDAPNHILYISDTEGEETFGGRCAIDCKKLITDQKIFYVDFNTEEVVLIPFSDLAVGDTVIINAFESQLNSVANTAIKVEQIELATQRLN